MSSDCALLSIPSELRLIIYQHLFNLDTWDIPRLPGAYEHAAGCCDLHFHSDTIFIRRRWGNRAFRNFTAIMRTCSLANQEATKVLYEQTLFNFRISDEFYNRKMRALGPLDRCAPFMSRIQQVDINPDARQHIGLLALPAQLGLVLDRLDRCPPSMTKVQVSLTTGSLSGFSAQFSVPEALAEEKEWQEFLRKISPLKQRCRFHLRTPVIRQNVMQRLEQLMDAVEGSHEHQNSGISGRVTLGFRW